MPVWIDDIISQSAHDKPLSDFLEFVVKRNYNNAKACGFLDEKLEEDVFAYVKAAEMLRHRYFRNMHSIHDATDSYQDEGYAIGFAEHWQQLARPIGFYRQILAAQTIEAVHSVIGDYAPISLDGSIAQTEIAMLRAA